MRKLLLCMALVAMITSVIAEAKLPRTNARDLKQRIQQLKGKVVIVNLWATWCQPCVEEMPELARFYRNYRRQGVVLIGVSIDDEPTADQTVPPVLRKCKVTYPVVVVKQDLEQFAEQFDASWRGEVPRFYIYNKQGKRVKVWSGSVTYAQLEREVKAVLSQR
ncbi:MAG: TlpA disulfide reductase family protein [Armatimonadota bacterium]|nr:TlpA disulfide reductase family protein [Armatimonadota bacterium]